MPGSHVALLRGINLGGKNKLSMTDPVVLFDGVGSTEVRTYIRAARSELTSAWMDSSLHTISTARNWRTVRKLVERLA